MKNPNDEEDINPHRYIILYSEIKENKGNEIDFFFYIKDKKERNSVVEYILKNNLWNYFKKINYNYKDEYKKIIEDNKEIGYVVRTSPVSRIENFLSKKEQKKSSEINEPKDYPNEENKEKQIKQKTHINKYTNKGTQSEDKSRKFPNDNFHQNNVQNNFCIQNRFPYILITIGKFRE